MAYLPPGFGNPNVRMSINPNYGKVTVTQGSSGVNNSPIQTAFGSYPLVSVAIPYNPTTKGTVQAGGLPYQSYVFLGPNQPAFASPLSASQAATINSTIANFQPAAQQGASPSPSPQNTNNTNPFNFLGQIPGDIASAFGASLGAIFGALGQGAGSLVSGGASGLADGLTSGLNIGTIALLGLGAYLVLKK